MNKIAGKPVAPFLVSTILSGLALFVFSLAPKDGIEYKGADIARMIKEPYVHGTYIINSTGTITGITSEYFHLK